MDFELNHIGWVVPDLEDASKMLSLLGLRKVTEPEPDPLQRVSACFFAAKDSPVFIELIVPTEEDSPVTNFLNKRGGGLHHLCFKVEDIERIASGFVKKGFQMVRPPVECIGYDRSFKRRTGQSTRVAFFLLPNRLLIELLQEGKDSMNGFDQHKNSP